ncbi:VOC family protein [Desulfoferula mesophila]|uniref:Methylmalonyl-CoA epimerase n=1 Tax=Desulfoferula mesophila TaxID=3058419 RepID=A0AAU9EJ85_9BACT|nr:methylmalonyl-CoA epimerase [Desulfoferula mesophilus]
MLRKIGHLGIAVENIEQTLAVFAGLFEKDVPPIKDVPEKKMKVAVLQLEGLALEFLQDYSEAGPLRQFVEQRGNGVHHFCVEVEDIDQAMQSLNARGIALRDTAPRMGLRGKRIAFLDTSALDGLTVELSEP